MKADIVMPEVIGISVAVTKPQDKDMWEVFIINENTFDITNVMIMSSGYGVTEGEKQKTSVLRYFFDTVPAKSSQFVELLDQKLFHLTNQYWVTYYVDRTIHDKKYLFLPDSIVEENLINIPFVANKGVLHT